MWRDKTTQKRGKLLTNKIVADSVKTNVEKQQGAELKEAARPDEGAARCGVGRQT